MNEIIVYIPAQQTINSIASSVLAGDLLAYAVSARMKVAMSLQQSK